MMLAPLVMSSSTATTSVNVLVAPACRSRVAADEDTFVVPAGVGRLTEDNVAAVSDRLAIVAEYWTWFAGVTDTASPPNAGVESSPAVKVAVTASALTTFAVGLVFVTPGLAAVTWTASGFVVPGAS